MLPCAPVTEVVVLAAASVLCGVKPQALLDVIDKDAARLETAAAKSILPEPR